jgi:hypothetical protein
MQTLLWVASGIVVLAAIAFSSWGLARSDARSERRGAALWTDSWLNEG